MSLWGYDGMTKEELINCRKAAIAMHSVKRRIRDLRESAGSVGGIRCDGEPRSRGEPLSRQQRYVEALEQLSEEYEETASNWARQAAAIERSIRSMPPDLGELIRLRYVDGLKWEQVNEQMYISHTQSVRMHHAALKKMGLE